eukprot:tig00000403_g265.t2
MAQGFCVGFPIVASGGSAVAQFHSRTHSASERPAALRQRADSVAVPSSSNLRTCDAFELRSFRASSFLGRKLSASASKGVRSALQLCEGINAASSVAAEAASGSTGTEETSQDRPMVFPKPTEFQYRAIGIISGRFVPSAENPRIGQLAAEDGTVMDARVVSSMNQFIQKIDLEQKQTFVVYPKTRIDGGQGTELRVDVAGVRNPVLKPDVDKEGKNLTPPNGCATIEDYFSVRGVVVLALPEEGIIVVKIQPVEGSWVKPFALRLHGELPSPAHSKFWDLDVRREGARLVIQGYTCIGRVARPGARDRRDDYDGEGEAAGGARARAARPGRRNEAADEE